jgi:hypothetical protein
MKYLNTKPGSIEEVAANMSKYAAESEYQQMFKKELEKAGKGIGAMTPAEKKAFFNKIDSKYTAKNEAVDNPYAVGMAVAKKMKNDEPPLKKSTITKAHDIAKSIAKDDKKEEVTEAKYPHKMYSKDGKEVEAKTPEDHKKYADMGYTHTKETHSFMTKDMNKSKKDAKGEKEIVDPEPKMKQESLLDAVKNVWQLSAEELEKIQNEANYMKAGRMNQYKSKEEQDKNKKGTADTGSKETKVDVEPSVDYKN